MKSPKPWFLLPLALSTAFGCWMSWTIRDSRVPAAPAQARRFLQLKITVL